MYSFRVSSPIYCGTNYYYYCYCCYF